MTEPQFQRTKSEPTPTDPAGKRNWLGAVCCFALAFACLWFARPSAEPPAMEAIPAIAAVTDTSIIETAPDYVAIQEVTLGRRALGSNPDRSEVDESLPDPDPETWREVRLSMLKEDGDRLRIELLRPLDWLADNAASVGSTVHLDLEEMGAAGPATVTYVGPCPPIQPGQGNVVTGRFLHESAGNLLDLHVEGDAAPVGVTDNHPYWSVDRQAFVDVGDLRQGERVDTLAGIRTVASIVPRPVDEAVFNLEIHREHVYRVGDSGTLVHNKCLIRPYGGPGGGHHIFAKKAFEGLSRYDKDLAFAIPQSEIARLGLKHLDAGGITQTQRTLFTELAKSGRPNTLSEHARIARESLVAGGLPEKDAAGVVQIALEQLQSWGIKAPRHIPWN